MDGNTARKHADNLDMARSQSNEQLSDNNQLQSPGQFNNVPKSGTADNHNNVQHADNYGSLGNHADRLAEAREKKDGPEPDGEQKAGSIRNVKDLANMAKNVAETASPMGAVSLVKQIDFLGDMPYVAAMGAALSKDLLDFVAAETVILAVVFSMLCSIFIFMMMMVVGSRGKSKTANALLKKTGFLIAGGVADSIPGLDFFPIETLTVAVVYYLTLVERMNASKE